MPGATSRAKAKGVRQSLVDSQVKTFRELSRVYSASRVRYDCYNSLESSILRIPNRLSAFLSQCDIFPLMILSQILRHRALNNFPKGSFDC